MKRITISVHTDDENLVHAAMTDAVAAVEAVIQEPVYRAWITDNSYDPPDGER